MQKYFSGLNLANVLIATVGTQKMIIIIILIINNMGLYPLPHSVLKCNVKNDKHIHKNSNNLLAFGNFYLLHKHKLQVSKKTRRKTLFRYYLHINSKHLTYHHQQGMHLLLKRCKYTSQQVFFVSRFGR